MTNTEAVRTTPEQHLCEPGMKQRIVCVILKPGGFEGTSPAPTHLFTPGPPGRHRKAAGRAGAARGRVAARGAAQDTRARTGLHAWRSAERVPRLRARQPS